MNNNSLSKQLETLEEELETWLTGVPKYPEGITSKESKIAYAKLRVMYLEKQIEVITERIFLV